MQPHQERVVAERDELLTKINRLDVFRSTDVYHGLPAEERWALVDQMQSMRGYLRALNTRISLWGVAA